MNLSQAPGTHDHADVPVPDAAVIAQFTAELRALQSELARQAEEIAELRRLVQPEGRTRSKADSARGRGLGRGLAALLESGNATVVPAPFRPPTRWAGRMRNNRER